MVAFDHYHRFKTAPEKVGWQGWFEDAAHKAVAFVRLDGTISQFKGV